MFQTLRNAWKIPDLRKRILYTLLMLVIFRFGSHIPVPGMSAAALQSMLAGQQDSLFNFLDTMTGGAFGNATIFAMSITPYINASIILQLLTIAIPALERISKEGDEGRKKIAQYTRYTTVILAFIQATGLYFGLRNAVPNHGPMAYITITLTFTAGTAFLMWLGEKITEKGIGNGISLLIFAGIVSRAPSLVATLVGYAQQKNWVLIISILVLMLVALVVVVAMNDAERRIPVQYAKRVVGRKMYGGQSSNIPIKVTMTGVMPIIFAMSITSFPATIGAFFQTQIQNSKFWTGFFNIFSTTSPVYAIVYFLLIIFFTYFYTAVYFSPVEMANNMKKNGGFVPGIRPGKPTSDYISKVLSRVTLVGAIFLGLIAVLPIFINMAFKVSGLAIGGTSLLIVVSVALETVTQMESQMLMRHYKGFLE